MLLPISDDDKNLSGTAYVTWALLLANVLVYALAQRFGANEAFTSGYSAIPFEITHGTDLVGSAMYGDIAIPQTQGPSPIYLTLISSIFMHGSLSHIGGNMLYLWIFGDNIEHRFGHALFVIFYFLSGLVASGTQIFLSPDSVIPTLGASGAIAGVMGAYLVLFPRNKVHAIFFFRIVTIPAALALGVWIALQLFSGAMSGPAGGGVAYGAHIGGFIAGALMGGAARLLTSSEPTEHVFRGSHQQDSKRMW